MRAIELLKGEISTCEQRMLQKREEGLEKVVEEEDEEEDNKRDELDSQLVSSKKKFSIEALQKEMKELNWNLAVAFNNCAIEFEYLGKFKKALEAFNNAYYLSSQIYGVNDEKSLNFKI